MANINDIESLFSLIGQSPNSYKEFYHEKNGLHALDKWSYLKNIQLENPNDEGISIFENRPVSSSGGSSVSPSSSMPNVPINLAVPVKQEEAFTPPAAFNSAPRIERYTSPVLDSREIVNSAAEAEAPPTPTPTFSETNEESTKLEPIPTPVTKIIEPLTPEIYNPAAAIAAPQAPKVYTTTAIPTVPTFSKNFNPMNASTSTTFTSSFVKATAPTPVVSTPNLQSTHTPPRFEPSPIVNIPNESETKSNASTASPLNSIFSRLEHK